ncbi:MAG: hypothetical protein ABEH43_10235, partial [Flavobacteriales bacterium]
MKKTTFIVAILSTGIMFSCGGGNKEKDMPENRSGNMKNGQKGSMNKNTAQKNKGTSPAKGENPFNKGGQTTDISDKELKEFYKISQKLTPIQRKGQQKLRKEIKDSDMGMKRFQEIAKAKQKERQAKKQGQSMSGEGANATKKEEKEFQALIKKDSTIRANNIDKFKNKLKKEDMSWKRFRDISRQLSMNRSLKQRYKKIVTQMRGGPK